MKLFSLFNRIIFFQIVIFSLICYSASGQIPLKGDTLQISKVTKKGKKQDIFAFPAIVYSPETTLAFGGAGNFYFRMGHDTTVRTSYIQGLALWTLRNQIVFGLESNIFFPNEKYILRTKASFSKFPDRFWGLGNNSQEASLEKYTISQYYVFPQLLRKTYKNLFLGIAYELQNVYRISYGADKLPGQSIFDQQQVVGRHGSFISGAGVVVLWDGRDNAFSPGKGFYFSYYFNQFTKLLGSDYVYQAQLIDVRKFITVRKKDVLAIQGLANFNTGTVPIRSLANIGSNSMLRGYYEGRYSDNNLIGVQAEYRFPIKGRFGAVVFASTGRVGSTISDAVTIHGLKQSYGGGVRYAIDKKEKLNLRLDYGFGPTSSGFYFNITEAF